MLYLLFLALGALCCWVAGRALLTAYKSGYVIVAQLSGRNQKKLYRQENPQVYWIAIFNNVVISVFGIGCVGMALAHLAGLKTK